MPFSAASAMTRDTAAKSAFPRRCSSWYQRERERERDRERERERERS